MYYFRWRTYRSHIHPTGRNDSIPWVVTEFSPDVSWAGMYNTINCAAGHHMARQSAILVSPSIHTLVFNCRAMARLRLQGGVHTRSPWGTTLRIRLQAELSLL